MYVLERSLSRKQQQQQQPLQQDQQYFCISDLPQQSNSNTPSNSNTRIKRIGVLWDCSRSRGGDSSSNNNSNSSSKNARQLDCEILEAVLRAALTANSSGNNILVDLYEIRDIVSNKPDKSFTLSSETNITQVLIYIYT